MQDNSQDFVFSAEEEEENLFQSDNDDSRADESPSKDHMMIMSQF